ncbi:MAG: cytochrome c3 family protein [Rhodothermales bacterium]|nr:cytochrome c3 family protein [Rhodothermales bacterium]MBO6779160.1 cytochrome c3 family protein [Rhodothermales bacterium]
MPQIFPRSANVLPTLSLVLVSGIGIFAIAFVWYYFSPEYTDVGYAPEQPVAFSHRLHAGELGVNCQYCHSQVENAAHSNVPATQTCMNCHNQIRTESLKLLPVRESWATGASIPWVKVHQLPDYAHFAHNVHIKNGVGCQTCHGRIDQMEVVELVEPLSMGWCIECHRQPELYLRPNDEITTMGYVQPADFVERNMERIRIENIQPPTNCSACHY